MAETFKVKILRQDGPHGGSYWQSFTVEYEDGMNLTTVMQRIAAHPVTVEGESTTPVAYDACCLEEVCGACTMVINGHVRQACSALVDSLLEDSPGEIEVRPMQKFPVIRDLFVNRRRIFEDLKKVKAWVRVDGYHDIGTGPRISPEVQESRYPLSRCITCGCCLDACPQYGPDKAFVGAAIISQSILFNEHPTGAVEKEARLEVLAGPGGIADCGNSQNCVRVCPKEIPLTDSLAKAGRDTTLHKIRRWFGR